MKQNNSAWCIFLVFLTQVTGFIPFGINLTILNSATPAITNFVNATYQKRYNVSATPSDLEVIIAMSQSFLIVGTTVGAIGARLVISAMSRKHSLVMTHVLAITGSLLMSVVAYSSQSYEVLILGRFINGISRGFMFPMIPLFIAETVTRRTLAIYQPVSASLLHIGSSIGNALGYQTVLGGENTWPYAMAVPAIFSVIFLVFLPWYPETPNYLLINSNIRLEDPTSNDVENEEAYQLLTKLRSTSKQVVLNEFEQLCKELEDDSKIQKATLLEIFSSKRYKKQLVAAILLQLTVQFCGLQTVFQYSNNVLEGIGISPDQTTLYSVGIFFLLAFTVAFCALLLMRRFGSKKMLVSGLMITIVGLILLISASFLKSSNMIYLSVIALILYLIGVAVGPLTAILSLPSEITTSRSRPLVLWLAGIVFWLVATVVAFVTPFLLSSIGGFTYVIFAVLTVFEVVYVWKFVPNTFKKSVSQIQEKLEKSTWKYNSLFRTNM